MMHSSPAFCQMMPNRRAEVDTKKAQLAQLAALQRAADAGASYTNAASLRLTEGLKARRFAQIFKYLAQARPLPSSLACFTRCSGSCVRSTASDYHHIPADILGNVRAYAHTSAPT